MVVQQPVACPFAKGHLASEGWFCLFLYGGDITASNTLAVRIGLYDRQVSSHFQGLWVLYVGRTMLPPLRYPDLHPQNL